MNKKQLARDLAVVINGHRLEDHSGAPDFLLAEYLVRCLENWEKTVDDVADWYDKNDSNKWDETDEQEKSSPN